MILMTAAELARAVWIMVGLDPPTPAMNILEPRFPLGRTYGTAAVTALAEKNEIDLTRYLRRHHCGDWGYLDADGKQANEVALEAGTRIFSAYKTDDRKTYVIIKADCSRTTIMLASEY
jgi:hypothetical protein